MGRIWVNANNRAIEVFMRHLPPQELTKEQLEAFLAIPTLPKPNCRIIMNQENTPTIAGERTQENLSGNDDINAENPRPPKFPQTLDEAQPEQQSENLGSGRGGLLYNGKTAKEWFIEYDKLQRMHTEAMANTKLGLHPLGVKPEPPVEVMLDSPQSTQ